MKENFRVATEALGYSWPMAIFYGTLFTRTAWMALDGFIKVREPNIKARKEKLEDTIKEIKSRKHGTT